MVIAATIGGYSINIDPNNDSTEPTNTKRVYKNHKRQRGKYFYRRQRNLDRHKLSP